MKRFLLFYIAILGTLATTAQTAVVFNHGDSINWYSPYLHKSFNVYYEQDKNGFFHQIIKPEYNGKEIKKAIKHGDGIIFVDEPFIQLQTKSINVSDYYPWAYNGESILVFIERSASISEDDITINIETNEGPDWIKIESFDGVICTFVVDFNNYDGQEDLEAKLIFKSEKYNVSDTLCVTQEKPSMELERNYVRIRYIGINEGTIYNIPLKHSPIINTDEIIVDVESNSGEWITLSQHYVNNGMSFFNFDINFDNYNGNDEEAKVIFKCEKYNLYDTLLVVLERPTFELRTKSVNIDGSATSFRVELEHSPILNANDIIVDTESTSGEWVKLNQHYDSEGATIYEFGVDLNSYDGSNGETKVIFKCEKYNLYDTLLVVLEKPTLFELRTKSVNIDGSATSFNIELEHSHILNADDISVDIESTSGEWVKLNQHYDSEGATIYEFGVDLNSYDGGNGETKVIFKCEKYSLYDTLLVVLENPTTFKLRTKSIILNNLQYDFRVDLDHSPIFNVDDIAIYIENNEGEWLNFNDAYGSCPRTFSFNVSLNNYVKHKREAKVIFRYEKYNLSDTLLVTLPASFLKAGKREYHGVDLGWPIVVTLTSNIKPDQLSVNVIGDDANYIQCLNPYWENGDSGLIAMQVYNLEQLEEIGQTNEVKIAITEKTSGCSDTISVFYHYTRIALSNSSIFYHSGEDIVELPIQTTEKGEITECDDMPECLHRLPDGEMVDGFVLRYQLDANNADESRTLSLRLKYGDCEMREGIYINQLDRNVPSADQQREALKAFCKAVEGKEWNHQWDEKPLSECDGVENAGNYIMWLDFGNSQMTGNLPEKELVMLMDAMPATSYNPRIILNDNYFYGKIPEKVVNHPRWQEFGWSIICQTPWYLDPQYLDASNCNLQLDNTEMESLNGERHWSEDFFTKNKLSIVMTDFDFSGLMAEKIYSAYHNKGLGCILALSSGNWDGITREEYIKLLNESSFTDLETTWNWDCGHLLGYINIIDSDSRIIASLGRVYGIPETWYMSIVDSVCRSRLGDPEIEYEYYTSSDYSRDGEIVTLQKASIGHGIDLVFMGDAYVDRDMETGGRYEEDMRKSMEYFFAVEPYKSLRDRFNVYLVKVVSPNEYIGDGCEQRINQDDRICYEYAQKIDGIDMDNVTITTIIKPKDYYQRSYANITAGSAVCYIFQGPSEVIVHEAGGHCIGKLGDEYLEPLPDGERYISEDEREAFRKALYDTFQVAGIYLNLSATDNPDKVPWAHMLKDERYKDEVGIYQGAWLYPKDLWRSSENSIMRDSYYGWFNAPSRELIYKRVMQLSEGEGWTYDYEKFVEFDTPVREAYKQQQTRASRQAADGKNVQKRRFDTKPPTFYKGTWRDAGKVEPIQFIFNSKKQY